MGMALPTTRERAACGERAPAASTATEQVPTSRSTANAPLSLADGLPPISRPDARVLVLGSFPGGRSLAERRYYAHGQNRFWPVMAAFTGVAATAAYDVRTAALLERRIALWDVLASCERPGSMDAAIVRASERPNDFSAFFERHGAIDAVCFNGRTAAALFARHVVPEDFWAASGLAFIMLPSTSPAHAAMRTPALADQWAATLRRLVSSSA